MFSCMSTIGSVICSQTTASEATFISLLAGRTTAIQRFKQSDPTLEDAEVNSRLVAYCSDQVKYQDYVTIPLAHAISSEFDT